MLKISRNDKQLAQLELQTLAQANIQERYHLQEYLFNSFDAFCREIDENLEIVGKEVRPSVIAGTIESRSRNGCHRNRGVHTPCA